MRTEFYILIIAMFIAVLVSMLYCNYRLMKSADKRLSKANEMVLTLAHSADMLSQSVCVMKDIMTELRKEETDKYKQIEQNRDDFREAYTKLLQTYKVEQQEKKELYNQYISSLRELANRPTIQNTHNTNEIKTQHT